MAIETQRKQAAKMICEDRRRFLTQYVPNQVGRCLKGFREGLEEARHKADLDQFFESYESSYALTLAYPDDILLGTARQNGIETEGRSKIDIAKELFLKKEGL
jgi:hypothetical protein